MNDSFVNYGFPVLLIAVCVDCGNPAVYNSLRCGPHLVAFVNEQIMLDDGYVREERVRYIIKDNPTSSPYPVVLDYHGGEWNDPGVDSAAAHPYLMMSCIAWVEVRYVKETEWEQA